MSATDTAVDRFLEGIRANAERAGVFGEVELVDGMLRCAAAASAEPAWYRIEADAGRWYVGLVTADRWLSESIEADLMHYGDPIEELIEEELVELGEPTGRPTVQHYRSEDLLYTFRSPLPVAPESAGDTGVERATRWLLAYEAAFRELGDMEVDEDEE